MPASIHDQSSSSNEETRIKPTEEERELFQQEQANTLTGRLFLAGAFGGLTYFNKSIIEYNFLKKPLDPQRLFADQKYRARIERAQRLAKRHNRFGLHYDETIVRRTDEVLTQYQANLSERIAAKENLAKQEYLPELQRIYGLSEKETQAAFQNAQQIIKENPSLSMQDAFHQEAQKIGGAKIAQEIDQEAKTKGERLNSTEREKRIEARKQEKNDEFTLRMALGVGLGQQEQLNDQAILTKGKQQVAQTLGIELAPETLTLPTSQQTIAPSPPIPSNMPLFQTISAPSLPRINVFNQINTRLSSTFFSPLRTIFSSLKGKVNGLAIKGIRRLFGFLGKQAIVKGLGGLLSGGLATALSLASDFIRWGSRILTLGQFSIDAERIAVYAIVTIVAIVVIIPILMLMLSLQKPVMYAQQTATQIPLSSSLSILEKGDYSWQDFEKKFLTFSENKTTFSWKQFENDFLALGSNGHN